MSDAPTDWKIDQFAKGLPAKPLQPQPTPPPRKGANAANPTGGIKSQRTIELLEMIEREGNGWDPVVFLARIAMGKECADEADITHRMDAARAIMPYLRPKLSAVQVDLNATETKVRRLVIEGLAKGYQALDIIEGEAGEGEG